MRVESTWVGETGGFEAHSEELEPDGGPEDEPESDSDEKPEKITENEDNPYYA